MTIEKSDAVSPSLSRGAFFEKLHYRQFGYKIEVYADIVETHVINPPLQERKVVGTKKTMSGFSDSSRLSMIKFLAKIERVPDLFVTLTYDDNVAENWDGHAKHDFELFRKQLEYHYPNVQAMWRMEFVRRKSGRLFDVFIPHFHLLVWLPEDTPQWRKDKILENHGQLWRNAWHNITHSTDDYHLAKFGCRVEAIKSRRHAYAYCSKYLAKENEEQIEAGRRWGRIGKFEQPCELETELSHREYVHFKRLLNAFLKAEALKRHKRQKLNIPYPAKTVSYYLQFYKSFVGMNIAYGSSVLGLGFNSQEKRLGIQTIYRMIRHARELAHSERFG